jgi:hypothetical protein
MLGEATLETVAVGKCVVCDDNCAFGVVEGTPAELVEPAVLVTAFEEI